MLSFVMPGLVPGIHAFLSKQDVDGRDKPGHDASSLPRDRAPGDIAPAEAVRPSDLVDRPIGARLRLAHGLAGCADIEHAAAIGEDARAVRPSLVENRAGVEDLDAFDLRRRRETLDRRALGVRAGIALRRHHYGQRGVA